MLRGTALAVLSSLLIFAGESQASSASYTAVGDCPGPQPVAFDVSIDFTPTGGDFLAGTGTATVTFTLENSSGLYPFQVPALGNPVLTGFYFNVPPGTGVTYSTGTIVAGSTLYSSGTTINGFPVPAGCTVLPADQSRTDWYTLVTGASTGQFGIFTSGLTTEEGIKGGLVDPSVFVGCVPQGDVFTPVAIAGQVRFEVLLTNLDTSLDSASDFASICSVAPGDQQVSSFAGKMQGTGIDGEESCFLGRPCPVPAEVKTWGDIKRHYH